MYMVVIFVFGGEVTPLPLVSICYIFILFSLLTEKSMNQHDMSQCNKKFCKFIFIGVTLKTDSWCWCHGKPSNF